MDDIFTPEQIAQILEEFFKIVGTRKYVGERYVPIFGRKGEESLQWDNSAPYEPLTIVLYQGNSYTSRQFVPIGVEITNQEFWALTGNYNAQIELYHSETIAVFDTVADMQAATNLLAGMTCHTNGFHASGDGGAAYYTISASGTTNGMDVLSCQGSLKATLMITEPYVTPEQFGAYGDGTHDDSTMLRKAFEHTTVELRNGATYLCSLVEISPNVTINGNGATVESGTNRAFMIPKTSHDVRITNITFDSTFTVGDTTSISNYCIGIFADNATEEYQAYNIEVDHCKFTFGVFGIAATSVQNLHIHDCEFYGGVYRPEDAAGGYAILTQSCSNVTIERCYFKLGMFARHDIYVSVSQTKTAFKSSRNYRISNCFSDRSLITEYANDAFYSTTILSVAVRSVYNFILENHRVYNGTGLVDMSTVDGPIKNAVVSNCINDTPRLKSSSAMPSEMRQSFGFIGASGSDVKFEKCVTLQQDGETLNNYSLSGGNIEICNSEINGMIDVGDCEFLHLHDLFVKGPYLRFTGAGVLHGKFYALDSDGSYNFGSATQVNSGAYIDINAYDDKLLGPWNVNSNGTMAFPTGKLHVAASGAAQSNDYGTIITVTYCNKPTQITRLMSMTDGGVMEANTSSGSLAANQVRLQKFNLSDGSAASSRTCRFYLC